MHHVDVERSPSDRPGVATHDLKAAIAGKAGADIGRPMTNKWVGGFLRNRLRLATMKSRGVYVVPPLERPKVEALAKRFGVTEDEKKAA